MALDKFLRITAGKIKDVFASVGTIYQGATAKTKVIIFNDIKTTTTGVATFNPTVDGTLGTAALFTNIYSINVTASINTSTASGVPMSGVKLISPDKKTVTTNTVIGGSAFCANGTSVYITIIGD